MLFRMDQGIHDCMLTTLVHDCYLIYLSYYFSYISYNEYIIFYRPIKRVLSMTTNTVGP